MKTRWTLLVALLAIAGCAAAPGVPQPGGAGYKVQDTGCTPAPTPTSTVDPGVEG